MSHSTRHEELEQSFRELLTTANLPAPDEVAHLRRALIFLWYDSKAFVLVDLDEVPLYGDPLDGLDVDNLRADILGGPFPAGFADAC